MKKSFIITVYFVTITALIFVSTAFGKEEVIKESIDSAGIKQRVIKIEGKVDKPRTIFIIPRTKLVGTDQAGTGKYSLDPIFPDLGVADQKK